jgi:hypothetical protein
MNHRRYIAAESVYLLLGLTMQVVFHALCASLLCVQRAGLRAAGVSTCNQQYVFPASACT